MPKPAFAALLVAAATARRGARPRPNRTGRSTAAIRAATKFSPLTDINPSTVARLAVAWEWTPREKALDAFGTRPGNFQTTPLMIDNVLYLSTPYNRVVALNAETGAELWAFDPKAYEDGQPPNGTGFVHRGVAAWRDTRQRQQAAHLHQQPLSPDLPRRGDGPSRSKRSARMASSI